MGFLTGVSARRRGTQNDPSRHGPLLSVQTVADCVGRQQFLATSILSRVRSWSHRSSPMAKLRAYASATASALTPGMHEHFAVGR